MALNHATRRVEGLQSRPELFLTPSGPRILATFLRRAGFEPRTVRSVVR